MRGSVAICVVALLPVAGCFVAYDYGDHQLASGTGGGSSGTAGEGSGGAGDGGEGGAGGGVDTCAPDRSGKTPGEKCRACYESQCQTVLEESCAGSAACADWYTCTEECCDPACHRACDMGAVIAGSPLEEVYACMCDKCGDECAAPAAPPRCP